MPIKKVKLEAVIKIKSTVLKLNEGYVMTDISERGNNTQVALTTSDELVSKIKGAFDVLLKEQLDKMGDADEVYIFFEVGKPVKETPKNKANVSEKKDSNK